MLTDITAAPTPENSAIQLNAADNVAVARVALDAGRLVHIGGVEITITGPVPAGHKIAIRSIAGGEPVMRYGQVIGRARHDIQPGDHIHVHNLAFEDLRSEYRFPAVERPLPAPPSSGPTFLGYARHDGRVGTRNYIAVVAASNCAAHTAGLIARSYDGQPLPPGVDGVVSFPHSDGCGHAPGPDIVQFRRTISGVLDHPNVSGALIVGLGCEDNEVSWYLGSGRITGLTLQSSGGTRATVEAGRRAIAQMIERAQAEQRIETPASKIVLGLNCGGSDSFSGITANPSLGWCSDRLVELGATTVLAETPENFGAEHLLIERARSRQVAERLLELLAGYRAYLKRGGATFDDNPSPGNKAGGLSNILEKSLGAVAKAGTSTLNAVLDYSERITTPGFVFMNTPGYDPASLAGLAAGGVNLIVFTTGRGSAIGFPSVPVIKVASNSPMFRRMRDNMDVNAGRIMDGESTVAAVGQEILDLVLRTASGERTRAEALGHHEFVPWRIGPVM